MMGKRFSVLLAATAFLLAACAVRNPTLVSPDARGRTPDVTVAMEARQFRFDPPEVRVKEGQVVALQLVATDRKHGFALESFGIRTELPEGRPVTVVFVANQRWEFGFGCNIFCGLGHLGMNGRLIVE